MRRGSEQYFSFPCLLPRSENTILGVECRIPIQEWFRPNFKEFISHLVIAIIIDIHEIYFHSVKLLCEPKQKYG